MKFKLKRDYTYKIICDNRGLVCTAEPIRFKIDKSFKWINPNAHITTRLQSHDNIRNFGRNFELIKYHIHCWTRRQHDICLILGDVNATRLTKTMFKYLGQFWMSRFVFTEDDLVRRAGLELLESVRSVEIRERTNEIDWLITTANDSWSSELQHFYFWIFDVATRLIWFEWLADRFGGFDLEHFGFWN